MLRLPSKIGAENVLSKMKGPIRDSSWFVAFGLCFMARENQNEPRAKGGGGGGISGIFKEFLRQFLP